ncbi:fibrinogen-like protein 1 [Argopecten irradians]|uniref:fibrinogen-like protein 1 n=1 Tax=Argopecten irradians TaxID=31199 RepID=UPI00370F789B
MMNPFYGIALFGLALFVAGVYGQTMTFRNQTFVLKWRCNLPVAESSYWIIGGTSLISCAAKCLENDTLCASFIWDKSVLTNTICALHQNSPASMCQFSNISTTYSLYEKIDTTTTAMSTTQSSPSTTVTATQDIPVTTANPCFNSGMWNGANCNCPTGCSGTFCGNCYTDCTDGTNDGLTGTAVIAYIQPVGSPAAFPVLCNFDNAITYIQYRRHGNISFNRDWQSYVEGFGDLKGDFWLGNKYIHLITTQKAYICGVRLFDDTYAWRFDGYSDFKVDSEVNSFTLTYTPFYVDSGMSPADSTKDSQNQPFSTHDQDPRGCATSEQAGWWYNTGCTTGANANGQLPFDWSTITGVTKTGMGLYY